MLACALVAAPPAGAGTVANRFRQINLVADQPGHAKTTDPNLVNPWGLSHGPNTPLWVSDNGTDVSTLYNGAVGGTPVSTVPLVVHTPGGAPTGQVFNDTSGFVLPGTTSPALFIFAGEDGDLSAWNQSVPTATEAVAVGHTPGAVFKGLALVHSPFGPLLLAANFRTGRVDVFNSEFHRLSVGALFHDKQVPDGYAPFNVASVGNQVVVTYAKQDADKEDDIAGAGHGFGDGWINAFDMSTRTYDGPLLGTNGAPLAIAGLWGLIVGDDAAGGASSVWFSAGPDDETHGLLGLLRSA